MASETDTDERSSDRSLSLVELIDAWAATPPLLYEDLSLERVTSSADLCTSAALAEKQRTAVKWTPLFQFFQRNATRLRTEIVTRDGTDYVDMHVQTSPSTFLRFDVYIIISDLEDGGWEFRLPTIEELPAAPDASQLAAFVAGKLANVAATVQIGLIRMWLSPPGIAPIHVCCDALMKPSRPSITRFRAFLTALSSTAIAQPARAPPTAPLPPPTGAAAACDHPAPEWVGLATCERCHVVVCAHCRAPWPTGRAWTPPLASAPTPYVRCDGGPTCPAMTVSNARAAAALNAAAAAGAAAPPPAISPAASPPAAHRADTSAPADEIPQPPPVSDNADNVAAEAATLPALAPAVAAVADAAPQSPAPPESVSAEPTAATPERSQSARATEAVGRTPSGTMDSPTAGSTSAIQPRPADPHPQLTTIIVDGAPGSSRREDAPPTEGFGPILSGPPLLREPPGSLVTAAAKPMEFNVPAAVLALARGWIAAADVWELDDVVSSQSTLSAQCMTRRHQKQMFEVLPRLLDCLPGGRRFWNIMGIEDMRVLRWLDASTTAVHNDRRRSRLARGRHLTIRVAVDAAAGYTSAHIDIGNRTTPLRVGRALAFWNVIGGVPLWGDSAAACHRDACQKVPGSADGPNLPLGIAYELYIWLQRSSAARAGRINDGPCTPGLKKYRVIASQGWPVGEASAAAKAIAPVIGTPAEIARPEDLVDRLFLNADYSKRSMEATGRFIHVDWQIRAAHCTKAARTSQPRCVFVVDTHARCLFFPGIAIPDAGEGCVTINTELLTVGFKVVATPAAKSPLSPAPPKTLGLPKAAAVPAVRTPAKPSAAAAARRSPPSKARARTPPPKRPRRDSPERVARQDAEQEALQRRLQDAEKALAVAEERRAAAERVIEVSAAANEQLAKAREEAAKKVAEAEGARLALKQFKAALRDERKHQRSRDKVTQEAQRHELRRCLVEKADKKDVRQLFSMLIDKPSSGAAAGADSSDADHDDSGSSDSA